jgi:3-methyladenine DNA glycosylase AlkD
LEVRAVYSEIRSHLRRHGSKKRVEATKRFFREPIHTYGLSNPQIHNIANTYVGQLRREASKEEILELCERLLYGDVLDEGLIVEDLMRPALKELSPSDFQRLDRWVDYFSNWAVTDSISVHVIGYLLEKYPTQIPRLKRWTRSKNRWRRRAAPVSLVLLARRKKVRPEIVFDLLEPLMQDYDDMVQKGSGWLLRELTPHYQDRVLQYLKKHPKAGRILVRYACEKLPASKRRLFIKPK